VGPRAGLDGCENLTPTGNRFPDRPVISESLNRLQKYFAVPGTVMVIKKDDKMGGTSRIFRKMGHEN